MTIYKYLSAHCLGTTTHMYFDNKSIDVKKYTFYRQNIIPQDTINYV